MNWKHYLKLKFQILDFFVVSVKIYYSIQKHVISAINLFVLNVIKQMIVYIVFIFIAKCKSCQSILDETDSFIKNSLLILPIKCPNKCEEKITFSSLEFHLQKCIKKPEPCYVKTCQFIGTKKEWNEHINNE